MKYYSEILKKNFDTVEDLETAESNEKERVVKAENERDRPAGNAGDAVSQRHAQAVKCRKQERSSPKPPRAAAFLLSIPSAGEKVQSRGTCRSGAA